MHRRPLLPTTIIALVLTGVLTGFTAAPATASTTVAACSTDRQRHTICRGPGLVLDRKLILRRTVQHAVLDVRLHLLQHDGGQPLPRRLTRAIPGQSVSVHVDGAHFSVHGIDREAHYSYEYDSVTNRYRVGH